MSKKQSNDLAGWLYVKSHYGFDGYGCGLCQTQVPCESKIPKKKDIEAYEDL